MCERQTQMKIETLTVCEKKRDRHRDSFLGKNIHAEIECMSVRACACVRACSRTFVWCVHMCECMYVCACVCA